MTDDAITPTDGDDASTSAEWEEQARNWIAWTRAPGLDAYWRYRVRHEALRIERG
ncbi:MAG TPA: hypothetical protein VGM10_06630 [Actinocrinis sp.]|jgi:hypothetical protein